MNRPLPPASDRSPDVPLPAYWLGLMLLLVAALALRMWHIDFGLPSLYHPDEGGKARVIQRILAGERPDYLNHPGLLINSVAALCALLAKFGKPLDQVSIVLYGRMLVALAGALTLLPAAGLARALFNRRAGLFAAAAVAFSPIHTVHSRYLKEDVYLAFWVVMAMFALAVWLRGGDENVPKNNGRRDEWRLLALAAAGMAMGSKYVGILMAALVVGVIAAKSRKRGGRFPAGRAWLLAGIILLVFIAVTPQIFYGLGAGNGDMWKELNHGVRGKGSPKLWIFEWPDLGTFFLFHGLGWGLSWPLALLGIGGAVDGVRRRRIDPALGWTAIAALGWYCIAEWTPIKRGADVERYVLPCVPLFAVLAAGVIESWRPGRLRWIRKLAPLLLLLPLAHSAALGNAIGSDTRVEAAGWLAAHGPQPPYWIAVLGDDCYQLDARLLPGVKLKRTGYSQSDADDRAALAGAALLSLTELETGRYENFPGESRDQLKNLEKLREAFPKTVEIKRPAWEKAGINNPDIELRFR